MDTSISLRFTGAIASAVAGEINRLEQHPEFFVSEGAAYKAAWDRQAPQLRGSDESPALNLCEAFRRDCLIASLIAAAPRVAALYLAGGHLDTRYLA